MKKVFSFLVLISVLYCGFACSSDETDLSTSGNVSQQITNTVNSGTWKLTRFVHNGSDQTIHFDGYTFVFSENNILAASNGTEELMGSWSALKNSFDDEIDFEIVFSGPEYFIDLADEWHIESRTKNKLELTTVSDDGESSNFLRFEKIIN
ncbi:hypothetical protein FLAN108750_05515 [Flavobacterium antarcticum]|uniref:hypothetical protein n=1 Tax=Flavobacterium antarcticum TaxID=271155 RepID=UPI0003B73EEB|nr:hypothetical protein [Flavobacterium antarcticum]